MREILQLIEEMQANQKQAAKKSRKHRQQIDHRLGDMQESIAAMQVSMGAMQEGMSAMQEGLRTTQEGLRATQEGLRVTQEGLLATQEGLASTQSVVMGLDRAVGGLRADVDQLEGADSLKQEQLSRLATVMNAFVDGYGERLDRVEARLERLEQKSA